MTGRIQSCYLTAPAGSNLEILTSALHERGIAVVVPQEALPAGDPASDLSAVMRDVDLVIGVIGRSRGSDWVLFELGQAWALGKRVLLFAPPKVAFLPSNLNRFLTVRANLSNGEAIEFALDQLTAAPERRQPSHSSSSHKKVLGDLVERYLQESYPIDTVVSPRTLERLVGEALRETGVDAMVTKPGPDTGVDIVIWSDALQPYVGNPLLIEIKSNLRMARAAAEAAKVLSQQVVASGAYWGLLLYGEASKEALRFTPPPNVLIVSIRTLFERMREETFDDIVRELRNRRVHGGIF